MTRTVAERDRITKSFPVFDCDAHIDDPHEIAQYIDPKEKHLVDQAYLRNEEHTILGGRAEVLGGGPYETRMMGYNPMRISGPGMNDKRLKRRFQRMGLTPEQKAYVEHRGAMYPEPRLKDMDLMGIDQVLIIPTMIIGHLPYADNIAGAYAMIKAYNNWLENYCRAAPQRLFGAGVLPYTDPYFCLKEIERSAKRGFPVVLIRPVDAKGKYPNQIFYYPHGGSRIRTTMDEVYRSIEDAGLVVGMHTFPANHEHEALASSPSEHIRKAGAGTDRVVNHETLSFAFEAMVWLSQVLLSGFLDRYPKLKMAIFESNASWVPQLLERCDLLFKLYRNERVQPACRLPSEAFYEQCLIALEGDEMPVFRQWQRFENIGIWSSDAYHHDGTDAWTAIRNMDKAEVPASVQAKLLGANARRVYGIEGKVFTTKEPASIPRPDWFPSQQELEGWWRDEVDPKGVPVGQRGRTAPQAAWEHSRG